MTKRVMIKTWESEFKINLFKIKIIFKNYIFITKMLNVFSALNVRGHTQIKTLF